ncbi:MFS transporter [Cloacibacillus evryensis]|uniref:MFS transporter n=1 Tax=Cloacibacillus evryensis TaxID=508460 RepID=UPI0004BA8F06|nr:MFS transporter [Cloacibacillus evryensis]MEA5036531.1 MFS transporter [Cloacibacillus evryensis]
MKRLFFVILLLGFMLSNLMRISGVVVLPPLGESLGLSASTIGFLSSLFFYTYGLSFGLWGVLIDRRGAFRCCGTALLVAACGSFIMMFSGTAAAIGLGRALCGLGLSSAFTGILTYCAVSFPQKDYGGYVGLSMVVGHSGTIIAVAPLGFAMKLIGSRGVFCVLGLFALALGAALLCFRKDDPLTRPADGSVDPAAVFSELWTVSKNIWKKFPLRVVMYTWGVSAAAAAALQGLWAVAWLQTAAGMPLGTAYLCATWISFGMVAGPAFGGWLVRCCRNEKRSFFTVCLLTQASWLLWLLLSLFSGSAALFGAAGFLIGFFNGCGYVFMGSAVRSLVPLSQNGGTIGVINMFLYLMVIIFQWGTGVCLDLFKAPAGGYTNLGFLSGFFLIVLLQGWAFWLITKVNSFKSA